MSVSKLQTDGRVTNVTVDGYHTTRVALSNGGGRAIGLVFAAFGDGPETAAKIVKAFNYHDELVEHLRIMTAGYKRLRALAGGDSQLSGPSGGIIQISEELLAEVTK